MLPRYGPVTTPNAMSNLHDITLNANPGKRLLLPLSVVTVINDIIAYVSVRDPNVGTQEL